MIGKTQTGIPYFTFGHESKIWVFMVYFVAEQLYGVQYKITPDEINKMRGLRFDANDPDDDSHELYSYLVMLIDSGHIIGDIDRNNPEHEEKDEKGNVVKKVIDAFVNVYTISWKGRQWLDDNP